MNLGLLHPTLPVGIIKELKDCVKGLVWIVDNIGKPSALIVFEEHVACDCHSWQLGLLLTNVNAIRPAKFEPTKIAVVHTVSNLLEKARANLS